MARYGNRHIPNVFKKIKSNRNQVGWVFRTTDNEGELRYKNNNYELVYNDKSVLVLGTNGITVTETYNITSEGDIVLSSNGNDLTWDGVNLETSSGDQVTIQGNSFNGINQLVQLDGSLRLPAVNGSLLTNLPQSNPFNQTLNTSDNVIFNGAQVNEIEIQECNFGDGDTGFYESTDDTLVLKVGNSDVWEWTDFNFNSASFEGPKLVNTASTVGTPTLIPNRSYSSSGIGSTGDEVRVITLGSTAAVFNSTGNLTTSGDINGRDIATDGATLDTLVTDVSNLDNSVSTVENKVGDNTSNKVTLGLDPVFSNKGAFTSGYSDSFFKLVSIGNTSVATGSSSSAIFGPTLDNTPYFNLNTRTSFAGTLEIIGRDQDAVYTSIIKDKYVYTIARGDGAVLERQLVALTDYSYNTAGLSYTLSIDYTTTPGQVIFNLNNTSVSGTIDFVVVLDGIVIQEGD